MNIIEISDKYPTELDAIKYFEKVRWGNKIKCPYCGAESMFNRTPDYRHHCKNKACDKSFSVTTGTHLHNTRLDLKKWMFAFCIISNAKKVFSIAVTKGY